MPAFYAVVFAVVLLLIGTSLFVGAFFIWIYSEKESYREPRRIICPENLEYATVVVDGSRAARSLLDDHQQFPIANCSRWPEMAGCDQACSAEVPLVADDRADGPYAPFGSTPAQIRRNNPVSITPEMLAKARNH